MKYRNFDPETNQPITALQLLEKLSQQSQFAFDTINIAESIVKSEEKRKIRELSNNGKNTGNQDLTNKLLDRYGEIAKLINKRSIKRRHGNKITKSNTHNITTISEYENYLNNKYTLVKSQTDDKIIMSVKSRINELLNMEK